MTIIDAVVQGVVQGLTEFLPVSSSGHLSITQHIMGVKDNNLFFNVMLHIGTLVAVCAFYHKLILRLIKAFFSMVKDVFTGKFKWKDMEDDRNMLVMLIIGLLPLFLLFLPVPGTDMKLKDAAEMLTQEKYFIFVGMALLITSLLLLLGSMASHKLAERTHTDPLDAGRSRMNVLDAVTVGITQFFAVLPGISRSGSTLAAGQLRGVNKQKALDYTFILAIPSILAAAVLELKDAVDEGVSVDLAPVLIGMVVAAVIGYLSIVLFKWLLKTDKMIVFILYTAIVGLAVVIIAIIETQTGTNVFTGAAI